MILLLIRLTNLDQNMQQHLSLLRALAACVKRQQTLAESLPSKSGPVSEEGQEADEDDIGSGRDLVEDVTPEPSVAPSDEGDMV